MNGRDINETRIFESVEKKLIDMPKYVSSWYLNLKASDCTAATCRDYVFKIEKFLRYINEDISTVQATEINECVVTKYYLTTKEKVGQDGEVSRTSDSYQITVWCCLNNFLGYLHDHNLISSNYMTLIKKPKNKDLDRINEHRILLTEDMFTKLREATNKESNLYTRNRDRAILSILMSTGMRETALLTIMASDIDLHHQTLTIIDKGNKFHVYNLNDKTIDDIKLWLNVREQKNTHHSQYLFYGRTSNMMSVSNLKLIVKKYSELAFGQSVSPHKIRSGYCSILYNKTNDIEFVRRAVGHAGVKTTQRYVVTKGDERKRAADIISGIFS